MVNEAPCVQLRLDADGAVGAVDHALAERQAQAVAGAAVGGKEGLEDARLQVGVHADAAVGDDDAAAIARRADFDQ